MKENTHNSIDELYRELKEIDAEITKEHISLLLEAQSLEFSKLTGGKVKPEVEYKSLMKKIDKNI